MNQNILLFSTERDLFLSLSNVAEEQVEQEEEEVKEFSLFIKLQMEFHPIEIFLNWSSYRSDYNALGRIRFPVSKSPTADPSLW